MQLNSIICIVEVNRQFYRRKVGFLTPKKRRRNLNLRPQTDKTEKYKANSDRKTDD